MSLSSLSNLQSIFRMIVILKIAVCSLKSAEQFPCVQNDSLVMNTLGNVDSSVVNILGSFNSQVVNILGSHMEQASEQIYKKKAFW
jgi:hypothetical protein